MKTQIIIPCNSPDDLVARKPFTEGALGSTDVIPIVLMSNALIGGSEGLVVVLHSFFDESYGSDGIFTVAGYAFRKSKLKEFELAWRRMLRKYKIPYFHMVDCAHGNSIFANHTKSDRAECAAHAIRLIGKYAVKGFAVTIQANIYDALEKRLPEDGFTSYEWGCWVSILQIRRWMDLNNWKNGAAYFFEAGHTTSQQTNRMMSVIARSSLLTGLYRYRGHAFVLKAESAAAQAADLLAWQARKDKKNQLENRPRRKDFTALAKSLPHSFVQADPSDHAAFVGELEQRGIRPDIEEFLTLIPQDFLG